MLKFVIGNRENLSGIISRNINTRFKYVWSEFDTANGLRRCTYSSISILWQTLSDAYFIPNKY